MAPPGSGPITPAAQAAAYTVNAQTPTTGLGPDARPVEGYKVSFTTAKGATGWVFIPYAMYSAANVKAMIAPHAIELDQVQDLKQGM